jgi:hypothetical protein
MYIIKTIHTPVKNIHILRLVKDKLGIKVTRIYCIPYECKLYFGHMCRTIQTKSKEHMRNMHLGQHKKAVVAEHRLETGHNTDFSSTRTSVPTKALGYVDCLINEAVEIRLHPRNFSRNLGFNLSWLWYPLTDMIKQHQNSSLEMTPNLENL